MAVLLSDKRCERSGCGKRLPTIAANAGDPYCSTQCCRMEHGLDPSTGLRPDELIAQGRGGKRDEDETEPEIDL